jgi:2-polyprenyl-6-hydroxyphenyl methylase/3-demethylubiquinone-9 3-methyltransferase
MASTATTQEVLKFDALAGVWWDPEGPMRALHRMNGLRTGWIADRVARAFGRRQRDLSGLSVLDVGCGAGLASEAVARMGARVVGIDAAGAALDAARRHAATSGLHIDYVEGTPEDLAASGARFDVVIALEVIEHVADRQHFLRALVALAKTDGRVFASTLNRTARSFVMAKIGAEFVLRLLPIGTHDWRQFVAPGELDAGFRHAGMRVTDITGMKMSPATGQWRQSRDLSVNYLAMAQRW